MFSEWIRITTILFLITEEHISKDLHQIAQVQIKKEVAGMQSLLVLFEILKLQCDFKGDTAKKKKKSLSKDSYVSWIILLSSQRQILLNNAWICSILAVISNYSSFNEAKYINGQQ